MIHGVINLLAGEDPWRFVSCGGAGVDGVSVVSGCLMMVWGRTHGTQRSRAKETGPSTWKLQCK